MVELATIRRGLVAFHLAAWLAAALPAAAGPPFVTDDPEPTGTGHWEIYNFAAGSHIPGDTSGQGGFDINYGGAKNLQLTAVVPFNYQTGSPVKLGDIELAVKYRFLHQSPGSWTPDVAFFPRLFTPTAGHAFGPQRFSLLLPVWGEKDFGPWSLFGGGGYDLNPGPDNRNFWLSGLGLTRAITRRLTLGAEVYNQTAATQGARPYTGLNLGAIYKLSNHWSLLGASGPGIENARREGLYDFYFALEATY